MFDKFGRLLCPTCGEPMTHAAEYLPKEMLGKWCRNQLTTWFDTYTRSTCECPSENILNPLNRL